MMADRVLVSNVQPTDVQMGGMGDWDLFMSGRLGMIPTGIWAFQSFADGCDFNWDITIEPGQEMCIRDSSPSVSKKGVISGREAPPLCSIRPLCPMCRKEKDSSAPVQAWRVGRETHSLPVGK